LVDLVHLVSFVQPNKRDKLNKQNNDLLMPAEGFPGRASVGFRFSGKVANCRQGA
jgi:hypothetical protein